MREPRMHYAGALRIVRGNRVTTIYAGGASCLSGTQSNNVPITRERGYATCKRCRRNIELHDASA